MRHQVGGLLATVVCLASTASAARPDFVPTIQHSANAGKPMSQSAEVIRAAYSEAVRARQSIVIYIHGRGDGDTMDKSNQEVIKPLEKNYRVTVLAFHWQGNKGFLGLGFPEGHAREAAPAFAEFLQTMRRVSQERSAWAAVPVALLAHSMGAIVVEEYIHRGRGPLPSGLCDRVILSSPTTVNKGHDRWLSRLGEAHRTYLVVNPNDRILAHSPGKEVLVDDREVLHPAPGVTYVKVTNVKRKHRLFQATQDRLEKFWSALFHGRTPDLKHDAKLLQPQLYELSL